jgi:hypothetical protein
MLMALWCEPGYVPSAAAWYQGLDALTYAAFHFWAVESHHSILTASLFPIYQSDQR